MEKETPTEERVRTMARPKRGSESNDERPVGAERVTVYLPPDQHRTIKQRCDVTPGLTLAQLGRQAFMLEQRVHEAQQRGATLVIRDADGRETEIWLI